MDLSALAYPAGFAVSNVIGKVIDYHWIQPKSHENYKEGLRVQHELRLEEFKQQHEDSIVRSFVNSGLRIDEQHIIEHLRASYSIWSNKAIKDIARNETNSPFFDSIEETRENLGKLYQQTKLPIILVAPFWDDAKPKDSNERGGYVDFRNSFNTCYQKAPWHSLASKQDGYFKRPLYQSDRDINHIYSVLSEIPIVLIHGTIQGIHPTQQYIQRIHPRITFWNLFSEQQGGYTSLDLRFFPVEFPTPSDTPTEVAKMMGRYSLDLQDSVGEYTAKAVGLLGSFYHTFQFGSRLNLQQFQIENEQELKALSFNAEQLYEILSEKYPDNSEYFQTEKLTLSLQRKLSNSETRDKHIDTGKLNDLPKSYLAPNQSWFTERLDNISETFSSVIEYARKNNFSTQWLDRILQLKDAIEQEANKLILDKFRILVIGDFNRGKSTILNVILRRDILPTGSIPTTIVSTFIKHGEKEEVIVHKKIEEKYSQDTDHLELLSLEKYNKKYTPTKRERDPEALKQLDYTELYCPAKILLEGIEFIDTGGLNISSEENSKVLSYISQCHAVIFVLGADYQFTKAEKEYLKIFLQTKEKIKRNSYAQNTSPLKKTDRLEIATNRPVFYLINKWETLPEEEVEEIKDYFIEEFSELFNLTESQANAMWGETIFNIHAKTATENLEKGISIKNTGFDKFEEKLRHFVIKKRTFVELHQAAEIAMSVSNKFKALVDTEGFSNSITLEHRSQDDLKKMQLKAFSDNISTQAEIVNAHYQKVIQQLNQH